MENKKLLVFVVRHGERADNGEIEEQKLIEYEGDPQLTKLGKIQAFKTGNFLAQHILQNYQHQVQKIKIITSPFLRCVMTADYIVEGVNFVNQTENLKFQSQQKLEVKNNQFYVDERLCEQLKSSWFQENVILERNLMIYRQEKYDFQKYVKNQYEFRDQIKKLNQENQNTQDQVLQIKQKQQEQLNNQEKKYTYSQYFGNFQQTEVPVFPEDYYSQFKQRFQVGYKQIIQEELNSQINTKNLIEKQNKNLEQEYFNECIVLVTHGGGVNVAIQDNSPKQKVKSIEQYYNDFFMNVEFCATTMISYDSNLNGKMAFKNYSDHLTEDQNQKIKPNL